MNVVPASIASRAELRAASDVQASFSGRRSMSFASHPENVPPSGASCLRKPRWAWALTAPGMMVSRGKKRTSASGFSLPTSSSAPTAAIRPSRTRIAPSRIAGAETGTSRPAAKIMASLSGIPSDHFGGYDLQKLALRAIRQELEPFEGAVHLAPGPRLGLGDGIGGEHGLYAGLEQLGRGFGRGEYPPDRLCVALPEGEDHGQRHGALGEVRPDALAHETRLPDQVHDVVRHLEGDAQGLPVGR